LLTTASRGHALQLLLGTDPINSPEILTKELKPLLDAMKAKYKMEYVPAFTPEELLQQARQEKINGAYVTLGYAFLLQQIGFVPLLVSKEQLSMVLVGKPNTDIVAAKKSRDQKIYFLKNDLFSRFHVHKGIYKNQWVAEVKPSGTSENVILKLLKEQSSLGFVMGVDLGLLTEEMRNNLVIYEREDIGPVFLLVNREVLLKWPEIQLDMFKFHKNFKDPSMKYNYLSTYHFKKTNNKSIKIRDEYSLYLKKYQ